MKLKDLVKKLAAKPQQEEEVEFFVWTLPKGMIVCCDMSGPATADMMKVLAKHAPREDGK